MDYKSRVCTSSKILEEIKEVMKDKHLTQEELAKEIGYSRKAFNRFLNKRNKNIDFTLLIKICKKLGIIKINID